MALTAPDGYLGVLYCSFNTTRLRINIFYYRVLVPLALMLHYIVLFHERSVFGMFLTLHHKINSSIHSLLLVTVLNSSI
jgi:hypothetical protein